MARFYSSRALFQYLIVSCLYSNILCSNIGINYGRVANNLPSPSSVVKHLQFMQANRARIYDADGDVLTAFANSGIEVVISIGNNEIQAMTDVNQAQNWIQQKVVPYFPQTKITGITVGNEVLGGGDLEASTNLFPAMMSVHAALENLGLNEYIYVSSPHVIGILGTSYPPSSGAFREDLAQFIEPILNFHAQTNSPFMINAYPFFAYKSDPENIPLDYALCKENPGVTDPNTNLKYGCMLHAQIDAVYAAMKARGHTDVKVVISETGWPSKGDEDETGATPENAGLYNGNLINLVMSNKGTPGNPSSPLDVYIFALFNENQKPGKESERNFGLLLPDATPAYDLANSAPTRSLSAVFPLLFLLLLIWLF